MDWTVEGDCLLTRSMGFYCLPGTALEATSLESAQRLLGKVNPHCLSSRHSPHAASMVRASVASESLGAMPQILQCAHLLALRVSGQGLHSLPPTH